MIQTKLLIIFPSKLLHHYFALTFLLIQYSIYGRRKARMVNHILPSKLRSKLVGGREVTYSKFMARTQVQNPVDKSGSNQDQVNTKTS